jgi:hypothetical protein
MTLNFPGPYQVDLHYTIDSIDHTAKLNCRLLEIPDPGITFDEVHVVTKVSGNTLLDSAVDDLIDLLKLHFAADCEFVNAELYACNPWNFDRIWLGSYAIGVVGTHAGVYSPASEKVHTYRTQEGGILKITLEETTIDFFAKTSLGAASSYEASLRDFIVSDANWILARDTSYPIAALNLLYGQNEVIFRRRYR